MGTTSAASNRCLAAVVLAAGGSSRLGRPKQLLRHRGEALVARSARLAHEVTGSTVIVVLGSGRQRLRSLLRRRTTPVECVVNRGWREGLASSLKAGIGHVPGKASAVLILLVDQPGIEVADLERLASSWRHRPGRPAAAIYAGRCGAPAIIPRRFFARIGRLEGDAGARTLLRELGGLTRVPMPAAAFDVDTPGDAAELLGPTAG